MVGIQYLILASSYSHQDIATVYETDNVARLTTPFGRPHGVPHAPRDIRRADISKFMPANDCLFPFAAHLQVLLFAVLSLSILAAS